MPIGFSSSELLSGVKIPRVDTDISSDDRSEEGITRYVRGHGGKIIASVKGSSINYYHSDRIQSNRIVTDSSGSIDKEFKALPFGQKIINEGVRFSFATEKELDESDLYYFNARYYDPSVGRFSSVDPVSSEPAYQYVENNPLYYVDPSGRATDYNTLIGASPFGFNPHALDRWRSEQQRDKGHQQIKSSMQVGSVISRVGKGAMAVYKALGGEDQGHQVGMSIFNYDDAYGNTQSGTLITYVPKGSRIGFGIMVIEGEAQASVVGFGQFEYLPGPDGEYGTADDAYSGVEGSELFGAAPPKDSFGVHTKFTVLEFDENKLSFDALIGCMATSCVVNTEFSQTPGGNTEVAFNPYGGIQASYQINDYMKAEAGVLFIRDAEDGDWHEAFGGGMEIEFGDD